MYQMTKYITLSLVSVSFISVLYIPILCFLKRKKIPLIRQISYVGLLYSIFLILFATIFLFGLTLYPTFYSLNLQPFSWLQEYNLKYRIFSEIIPNILMFIPLGICIPLVFKPCRNIGISIFIFLTTTISIETIQYFIGRSADIDDVIFNLIGGIFGFIVYIIADKFYHHAKWWIIIKGGN